MSIGRIFRCFLLVSSFGTPLIQNLFFQVVSARLSYLLVILLWVALVIEPYHVIPNCKTFLNHRPFSYFCQSIVGFDFPNFQSTTRVAPIAPTFPQFCPSIAHLSPKVASFLL